MSNFIQKNKKVILFPWIFIFLFYLILASILIHSGDDWAWGGKEGAVRLDRWFDNYNGRYIGNIIIILITRSFIAKTLIYALINTGIIYFMWKILNKKTNISLIFFSILIIPLEIYRETYGWLSGFANYNISAFLILLILYIAIKKEQHSRDIIVIFIVAFISQFFVENVSIANIVMATAGILIAFIFKRRILVYISWLGGALLGAYFMFSNSAYHASDNMRGLSNVSFSEAIDTFYASWLEFIFKDSIFLIIFFALACFLISKRSIFDVLINSFVSIYFLLRYIFNFEYNNLPTYLLVIEASFIILFVIYIFVIVFKSNILFYNKVMFYIFFITAVLLAGPFLFVTPFGPRNILLSYILLTLALLFSSEQLLNSIKFNFNKLIVAMTIAITSTLIMIHGINKIEDKKRISFVQKQYENNIETIILPRLPFQFIGHDLTPRTRSIQSKRQKSHYNIPRDAKLKLVDFKATKDLY